MRYPQYYQRLAEEDRNAVVRMLFGLGDFDVAVGGTAERTKTILTFSFISPLPIFVGVSLFRFFVCVGKEFHEARTAVYN